MDQLSVVLAKFPFTNQIDYKIRSALIISNSKFNAIHQYFWVCPITSKTSMPEFELELTANEFSGKLDSKSYIRTDNISSLEKGLFIKEIGKISAKLFEKLKAEISKNI